MLAASLLSSAASAATIFDTSITAADGYSDGPLAAFVTPSHPGILGQGTFSVFDSAGSGFLAVTNGTAFTRALFGVDNADTFDEAFLTNLPTGESITVEALGINYIDPQGSNVGVFGLSNINDGNPAGGSSLAIGVQLTWDGTNLLLDTDTGFPANGTVNTGIGANTAFDLSVTITATAPGVYDVTTAVNGSDLVTATGVAANLGNSSTDLAGHVQDFGGAGAYAIDGLRITTTVEAIPEPTSLAALGFGTLIVASRRRSN